ncbi:MFS transporter [Paenibacillus protaetiae]|uniref:MFS transporter n=2 Tax=Paenibacillus protaetiae TaxID=2509456 RepID=A0A4V0YFN7_9BACL|nr:MFS transporter [Paenibacillus protaetiae]
MTLGNSMLIPVLPAIRKQLSITSFQSSLLITVYSVMAIILIPLAGYLSDRFGRKKIIIPALIVTAVGGAICGAASMLMAHPYGLLVGGRIVQGIGAAGAMPIVIPLVGDLFKSEEQVSGGLGLIETSNTFGKVLSPILGSLIAWLSWYAPFLSIPVFCAISILLVAVQVKPPRKEETPVPFHEFVHTLGKLFRKQGRWLYVVFASGGLAMFMLFAFLIYLSDTLEEQFHLKGIGKGFVLAVPLALLCTASYLTGKIIGESKARMKWMITGGFVLSAIALFFTMTAQGLVFRIALLSVSGVGIGAALPALDALITEGVEKEERGTVTSLYSSLRFVGVALGPPVASLLAARGSEQLFWTLAGASLLSAVLVLFGIQSGAKPAPRNRRNRQVVQRAGKALQ